MHCQHCYSQDQREAQEMFVNETIILKCNAVSIGSQIFGCLIGYIMLKFEIARAIQYTQDLSDLRGRGEVVRNIHLFLVTANLKFLLQ